MRIIVTGGNSGVGKATAVAHPGPGSTRQPAGGDDRLPSGTYLAPRFNQWGKPKVTKLREKARDPAMARALWELSAELTGCDWNGRHSS